MEIGSAKSRSENQVERSTCCGYVRGRKAPVIDCLILRDTPQRWNRPMGKQTCEYGGVAQLGEHLPCKQGVDSSILFVSTSAPERERQKQVGCKGLDRDGHRYGLIAQVVRARA